MRTSLCCGSNFDSGPPLLNAFSTFSPNTCQLVLSVSVPSLASFPIKVLIDSGCTRSFVDHRLIKSSKHSVSKICPPISLRLFDGSLAPSGPISASADIKFSLPGSPPECFSFLVTQLDPSVSLALGYDWLVARNPDIDWRTGQITLRDSVGPSMTPKALTERAAAIRESPKPPPLDIKLLDATEFAKLAYEEPVLVGSIRPCSPEVSATAATPDDEEDDGEVSPLPRKHPGVLPRLCRRVLQGWVRHLTSTATFRPCH